MTDETAATATSSETTVASRRWRSATPAGNSSDTSFFAGAGLLAVAGVAIRVAVVRLNQWNVPLRLDDAAYYYLQGHLIRAGQWFIDPFANAYSFGKVVRPSAVHPPVFSFLVATADALHFGSVNAMRLFCCLIGGVGIFMVGLLGREIGGRRVGLLAAAIAAVYPIWWLTDGLILSEVVYVPLIAGLLLLAYRLWKRPRVPRAVALGVVGGLAALTRSEGILVVFLVAAGVLLVSTHLGGRRRVVLLAVTMLAAVATIAPWIGYNLNRFDHPVYLSTNDGATLADTNCPATYYGPKIGTYQFACHTPKVREFGDESNHSDILTDVGVRYARKHSSRVPVVVAARVGRVWGVFQPIGTIDLDSFGKWSHRSSQLMFAGYVVVALSGLIGLTVLRRRSITVLPLIAAMVSVTITAAAFYGIIRFRVPGDVTFVVLAAVALDALISRGLDRRAAPSR